MSKITKLSPLMQFFLIFIASIGMIMGMGYIFMGIIGDNFVFVLLGILMLIVGIGAAIKLFSES